MTTATPMTGVLPFRCGNVEFRCWAAPDGVNELNLPATRVEWRTADRRLAVFRVGRSFQGTVDGRPLRRGAQPSLLMAMMVAAQELQLTARMAG